jgi:superfamily II DNA or RNA helicase
MYQLEIPLATNSGIHRQLRDYQEKSIDQVIQSIDAGFKRIALVIPTGGGKSLTVSALMKRLNASHVDTIAMVPRTKLKKQLSSEFRLNGLSPSIVKTAQSLTSKRLNSDNCRGIKYIILDECHEIAWWHQTEQLISINEDAVIIGLTATPDRTDRRQFMSDKFDRIISPVTFGDLVLNNYLCNPVYFSYGGNIDVSDIDFQGSSMMIQDQLDRQCKKIHFNESVVRNLLKNNVSSRRSIVFCSSISQSKSLAEMLIDSGISAIHVDGTTSESDQDKAIASVANGDISALCCAKLLIAGFDEPRIDTVVLATATNSRQTLVQMCGRGSRIHPEKNGEFWVFDFGDNFTRLGIGLKQKFPFKVKPDHEQDSYCPSKICPDCDHATYGFIMVCPKCGYIFEPKEKPTIDVRDMDVIEVEVDKSDIQHVKNIRKLVRKCFSKKQSYLPDLDKYLESSGIPNISVVMPRSAWLKCLFSEVSLPRLLDVMIYVDKHISRLRSSKFSASEESCIERYGVEVVSRWVSTLDQFPELVFGRKFLTSKDIKTYLPTARWQDALNVLDFDTDENIKDSYKSIWKRLTIQIEKVIPHDVIQNNSDDIKSVLEKGNSPDTKDLYYRICVIEWAYAKYIGIHKSIK